MSIVRSLLFLGTTLVAASAHAATVLDESVDGDLSGDRLAPTTINLQMGVNSVIATTGSSPSLDQEYLRINLPVGHQLDEIVLASFVEGQFDSVAFIGVQSGTTFTFDAGDAFSHVPDLLGYAHFGPGDGDDPGTNILPKIGQGAGAQGFVGSLSGPSYTFWLQQTGGTSVYQLDFVVSAVPEPATLGFAGLAGMVIAAARGARRVARIGLNKSR
jgi:hypothetical protein